MKNNAKHKTGNQNIMRTNNFCVCIKISSVWWLTSFSPAWRYLYLWHRRKITETFSNNLISSCLYTYVNWGRVASCDSKLYCHIKTVDRILVVAEMKYLARFKTSSAVSLLSYFIQMNLKAEKRSSGISTFSDLSVLQVNRAKEPKRHQGRQTRDRWRQSGLCLSVKVSHRDWREKWRCKRVIDAKKNSGLFLIGFFDCISFWIHSL